jgi:ornithine cyclodeaminase/alanine dehydrogenase-like protein (mu-crystallin family)
LRVFDAGQVRERLPFSMLVPALCEAFARGAVVPPRLPVALAGDSSALLMPAWREGGLFAVKTVTIAPGNGARGLPGVHALVTAFDATTGVPLAVLDGSELTARRTAAASALAASFLARDDAHTLLLVGAGRVAALMPEALRTVRPGLRHVRVWNHRPDGAERLAAALRAQGFEAESVPEAALETAVRSACIVSCATLAQQALVQGAWLADGAHLDLIGSFTPAMREADAACLRRARVFIDTDEALAKAGCLLQAVAEGAFDATAVQGRLADLCQGRVTGRGGRGEITLFKSVGNALEDLAATELVLAGADNPAA